MTFNKQKRDTDKLGELDEVYVNIDPRNGKNTLYIGLNNLASRFLSNKIQLDAVNRANAEFLQTGKTSVTIDMGTTVGEGYLKGGGAGSYRMTNKVQAFFKDGKLNTIFPLISK